VGTSPWALGGYGEDEVARTIEGSSAEIRVILDAMEGEAAVQPERAQEDDNVTAQYLYRRGSVLVREQDIERVHDLLSDLGVQFPEEEEETVYRDRPRHPRSGVRPVIPGAARLVWSDRDEHRVPEILDQVDARLGLGTARPDHLLVISSHPCSAAEPVPGKDTPFPGVTDDSSCNGQGVVVAIVDTGLAPDYATHPWLANGVNGNRDQLIAGNDIKHFGCHGTFVAGCLRAIAPRAEVSVQGTLTVVTGTPSLTRTGAGWESDLAYQLTEALKQDPDILVMTYATESRENLSLLGFDVAWETRLQHAKGLVFLAPAGNDSSSTREWPAAFDWVLSVGALSANWQTRADFSNFGDWVDLYAPGEDLVNAFTTGRYTYVLPNPGGPTADFTGMAKWSGTSFSTPLVAGLIAARMSVTGESGHRAAQSLLDFAWTQFIPGVGAVLFPGQACCDIPGRCQCHGHRHRCGCGRC
jgi:subtilisin family serine protease